jgi:hypothetical protein
MSELDRVITERIAANILPRGPHMSVGMIGAGRFSCVGCGAVGEGPHAFFTLTSGLRFLLHPECFEAWRRVSSRAPGDGAPCR